MGAALAGCRADEAQEAWVPKTRKSPFSEEWRNRVGVARGPDPAENVRFAVEKLCGPDGLKKFIRDGDVVAVKPNIGWARPPALGANTDARVVAEVVRMCRGAADGVTVKVFDNTIDSATQTYHMSGIQEAASSAGAEVVFCQPYRFRMVKFTDPRCKALTEWPIFEDALEADVLINVAAAKEHNTSVLTLCMKNLMGLQGGQRGNMHKGLHRKICDLNLTIQPTLNILDATRVMVHRGPSGGSPDDVVLAETVIVGTSAATVDAYAAQNLPWPKGHHRLSDVEHIVLGAEAGLGEIDKIEVAI